MCIVCVCACVYIGMRLYRYIMNLIVTCFFIKTSTNLVIQFNLTCLHGLGEVSGEFPNCKFDVRILSVVSQLAKVISGIPT